MRSRNILYIFQAKTILQSDFLQSHSLSDIDINSFLIKPTHQTDIQNLVLSLLSCLP